MKHFLSLLLLFAPILLTAQLKVEANESIHTVKREYFKVKTGDLLTVHVKNSECTQKRDKVGDRSAMAFADLGMGNGKFDRIGIVIAYKGSISDSGTIKAEVLEFLNVDMQLSDLLFIEGMEIKLLDDVCFTAIEF